MNKDALVIDDLVLLEDDGDTQVWLYGTNGAIIGSGATRVLALAAAVETTKQAYLLVKARLIRELDGSHA